MFFVFCTMNDSIRKEKKKKEKDFKPGLDNCMSH